MKSVDLSVKLKGVTFRNPIIPGSSDIVQDERGVIKCIEQGVGGVLTKSFSSTEPRTRARPWHFNYRVFGKGFESSWISRGGHHCMSCEEAAEKLIPRMSRLCRDERIPLMVSIADGPSVEQWVTDAKRFEEAGADMLELNFSCPHAASQTKIPVTATLGHDTPLVMEIMRALKKAVRIPISGKVSIMWDPITAGERIKAWTEAGTDILTCHNSIAGMMIDVEEETPFGGLGGGGYELGRAYLPFNLWRVVETKKLTDTPIIASGGVWQATDAIMYLLVGCPVVEVCQAVFKNGYGVFGEIIKGIEEWMERKGYASIEDFRGKVFGLASQKSSAELMYMEWPFPMPQEKSSPIIPMVDMDRCILCERCEDFCLSGVFTVDKLKGTVNIDHENRCWGCGDCVGWCPVNAISLIERETKEVVWDNHGLAKPYRPESWKR